MKQSTLHTLRAAAFAAVAAFFSYGAGAQTIKIAYIDPLSGGAATIGEHGLKHLQYLVETINAKGGVIGGQKLEAVAYDNKGSPQESLVQVQKAIDAGVRFITQGNGSGAAIAISATAARSVILSSGCSSSPTTWMSGRFCLSMATAAPRTACPNE